MLRYLATRFEVSLGCVTQEPVPVAAEQELRRLCRRVAIASTTPLGRFSRDSWQVLTGGAASEGHFWSQRLASAIEAWAQEEEFDAVLVFCSGMHRLARLESLGRAPVVVDMVDVDSQKWAECAAASRLPVSWLLSLEARRVRQLERRICRDCDEVLVVSDLEEEILRGLTGRRDIRVVRNGVDLQYFQPPAESAAPAPHSCCFVGVLNYQPNVDGLKWFVERVWPRVLHSHPNAQLRIVGRSPSRAVWRMEAASGVKVCANVPDVRPFLSECGVAIAPLRIARGIQNKVLEAMAMGRPVVASPAALAGIPLAPCRHAVSAESPEEWANWLTRLFNDQVYCQDLGRAARRFVEESFNWDRALEPLGQLLNRSVAGRMSETSPIGECVSPGVGTL